MARFFADASDQGLSVSATPISAAPFSVSAWIRCNDFTNLNGIFSIDNVGASGYFILRLAGTTGTPEFLAMDGDAQAASSCVLDTWHQVGGITASSTSRFCYLDGVSGTEDSQNKNPGSLTTTWIGGAFAAANAHAFDGDIAEVGLWDVVLTTAEMAILAKGYSPLFVRPASLVGYWPLINAGSATGSEVDRVGGNTMTHTGSPTVSAHPRIIYPSRRQIFVPAAAAASAVFPPLMGKIIRAAPAY